MKKESAEPGVFGLALLLLEGVLFRLTFETVDVSGRSGLGFPVKQIVLKLTFNSFPIILEYNLVMLFFCFYPLMEGRTFFLTTPSHFTYGYMIWH